jgi:predicted N-formylglutamate amidohydrolase
MTARLQSNVRRYWPLNVAAGTSPSIDDYVECAKAVAAIIAVRSDQLEDDASVADVMKVLTPIIGAIIDQQMPQLQGKATLQAPLSCI